MKETYMQIFSDDIIAGHAVMINRKGVYEHKNVSFAAIAEDVNLNLNTHGRAAQNVKNCRFYSGIDRGVSPDNFQKKQAILITASVVKTGTGYFNRREGAIDIV